MLRCFVGGTVEESDEELVGQIREELHEIMGLAAKPVFSRVSRWPRSMAQYTVGHQRRVEAIQARLKSIPGLYLAGNAYTGHRRARLRAHGQAGGGSDHRVGGFPAIITVTPAELISSRSTPCFS